MKSLREARHLSQMSVCSGRIAGRSEACCASDDEAEGAGAIETAAEAGGSLVPSAADRQRLEWLEQMTVFFRHEVRTAIAGVRASLFLLGRELDAAEGAIRYVERGSCNLDLLEDFLDGFSRAVSLGDALCRSQRRPMRLDELIDQRLQDYSTLIYQSVRIDGCVPHQPIWILGNANQLLQVLDNLMANAVRHHDRLTPISVSIATEGDCAVIEVENWGSQLSEEILRSINAPEHSDMIPAQRIGLFLVRSIIDQHGGSLQAVNVVEENSVVFRVLIPMVRI